MILIAALASLLIGAGIYLVLSRAMLRVALGLAFIGYGANLAILTARGDPPAKPPILETTKLETTQPETTILETTELEMSGPYADPLPQALVLTAIVIGFGTTALTLALSIRAYRAGGEDVALIGAVRPYTDPTPEEEHADPESPTTPEEYV